MDFVSDFVFDYNHGRNGNLEESGQKNEAYDTVSVTDEKSASNELSSQEERLVTECLEPNVILRDYPINISVESVGTRRNNYGEYNDDPNNFDSLPLSASSVDHGALITDWRDTISFGTDQVKDSTQDSYKDTPSNASSVDHEALITHRHDTISLSTDQVKDSTQEASSVDHEALITDWHDTISFATDQVKDSTQEASSDDHAALLTDWHDTISSSTDQVKDSTQDSSKDTPSNNNGGNNPSEVKFTIPTIIPNMVACLHCDRQFENRNRLNDHVKDVHKIGRSAGAKRGKFYCPHCTEKFINNKKLSKHIHTVHELGVKKIKLYPCPTDDCEETFSRKDHLDEHVRTIHKSDENFVWTSQQDVDKYMSTMADGKKIICKQCDKVFSKPFHAEKHVKYFHFQEPKIPCPSEGCKYTFVERQSLAFHIRRHHPGLRSASWVPYKNKTNAALKSNAKM